MRSLCPLCASPAAMQAVKDSERREGDDHRSPLCFWGVRPVQATGRVGAKHKGGVALRGSGEAGSGWNLCEGLPACRGARSGWCLHPDHGFPGRASPLGTRGARSPRSLAAAGARQPAGGARVTSSRAAAPADPDPGLRADPEPGRRAARRLGERRPRGPSRSGSNWSPEQEVGGDLPAGDKQAINSAAKFPSARPADNRSRAHPRGHLLPLPGRTARTLAFLHARGCEAPRAVCRHA